MLHKKKGAYGGKGMDYMEKIAKEVKKKRK